MPRKRIEYKGVTVEEMDLDAVLARRPQVAIVDELAHSNAPFCRNKKRYQDALDLFLLIRVPVVIPQDREHGQSER